MWSSSLRKLLCLTNADLNTHMHMDNMPQQPDYVVEQAKALDSKAAQYGVDSIAPLSVHLTHHRWPMPRPRDVSMTWSVYLQVRSAGTGERHDGND